MKTIISMFTVLMLAFVSVSAQEEELGNPGVTPDNPLYFLDVAFDQFQTPEAVMNEKMAEAVAMARAQNQKGLAIALDRYGASVDRRMANANSDDLRADVAEQTSKHIAVLTSVREQVPDVAKDAIDLAISASTTERARAITAITSQELRASTDVDTIADIESRVPASSRDRVPTRGSY